MLMVLVNVQIQSVAKTLQLLQLQNVLLIIQVFLTKEMVLD
jgi:hypothetical protein